VTDAARIELAGLSSDEIAALLLAPRRPHQRDKSLASVTSTGAFASLGVRAEANSGAREVIREKWDR
jgi:hypothetical protein